MIRQPRRKLLDFAASRNRRLADRRPSTIHRLVIEGLEDRTLLSQIVWDSTDYPSGGSWDTATNWIGGKVPGTADTAVIDLTSGTVTTGPSNSVLSLMTNSSTTVSVSNGSLTLGAATSTINGPLNVSGNGTLLLSGATLVGTGALTDSGHLTSTNAALALPSTTMSSGSALNVNGLTVQQGATLNVAASVPVTIGPEPANGGTLTLTDNGTLTFATGNTVTLIATVQYNTATQIVVGNGGLLDAAGTTFNSSIANGGSTYIVVSSGGELQASGSSFALTEVYLYDGVVFNPGDLTGDAFDSPLYIPAIDVQYLSGTGINNLRFYGIYIQPDTIVSGQTLALNAIGTQTTTNLRYVFPSGLTVNQGGIVTAAAGVPVVFSGGLTVQAGGTVTMGANDPVTIGPEPANGGVLTLADNGTLTFATGDTVTLIATVQYSTATQIVVGNGGLLDAAGTTFNSSVANGGSTYIVVSSGGELQASGSSFALTEVYLYDGVVFNPGDLTGDAFDSPLYIPAIDVQYLSGTGINNLRFYGIYIQPDTIVSGQTLALNAIGTQTTTNLRYVFPSGLTVNQGGIVTAAAGVPVVFSGGLTVQAGGTVTMGANDPVTIGPEPANGGVLTLADNGTLTFATGDTVTLIATVQYSTATQIVVGNGGLLDAAGTTFNSSVANGGSTYIVVSSGGELQASGSSFALTEVYLYDGVVFNPGDLTGDAFDSPLYIPAIDVQYLSGTGINNLRFYGIYIQPDTIVSGQTLALNAIGTQTTTNLRYVFPSGLTVNQGGIVTAAAGVPVVFSGGLTVKAGGTVTMGANDPVTIGPEPANGGTLTLADNGTLTFATGNTVTLIATVQYNTADADRGRQRRPARRRRHHLQLLRRQRRHHPRSSSAPAASSRPAAAPSH